MIIAIQPDDYTRQGAPAESDASSPRWARLLEQAGHQVRWVNVYRADILRQLDGCDGFMWRWAHLGEMWQIAHRLLPVLEKHLGLAVYPNQNTCWHYDDKIAQAFLLSSLGIPTPQTWIWFEVEGALEWAQQAKYPLVLKLSTGAGSCNVRLVKDKDEAIAWIDLLFDQGTYDLDIAHIKPWGTWNRLRAATKAVIRGEPLWDPPKPLVRHGKYVLFQEFLPDNPYDTRITIIGRRAFAFRRFNRPNDFRASGSGILDVNPDCIDPSFIRLGFRAAHALKAQSVALDGIYREGMPVTTEISYTYVSSAVEGCPGHWELEKDSETGTMHWRSGHMWPEEAQVSDFLWSLQASR